MDENPDDMMFTSGLSRTKVLDEYYSLLKKQDYERKLLLDQINQLITAYNDPSMNEKSTGILEILREIKQQFESGGKKQKSDENNIKTSTSEIEIKFVEQLPPEIQVLHDLLESKKEEVLEKDQLIVEYNSEIESISAEKNSLIIELEKLNRIIESWKSQLEMLESMAKNDPRFLMIEALKSHDKLTEIQLAFALGTSISQIRRFTSDLLDMELVKIEKDGRIRWIVN